MMWIAAFAGALAARLVFPRLGLAMLLAAAPVGFLFDHAARSPEVLVAAARFDGAAGGGAAWLLAGIAALAAFVIGAALALLRAPR